MSKPYAFEKPVGMRDVLPELVRKKEQITEKIQQVFHRWGYARIETPTLEYFDTVGDLSPTLETKMFKLLDRSGRSLVLRPDFTAPIARVVASLLKEEPFPIRLSYQGPVYRAQETEAGRDAEFPEVGVELIGEEAPDADAEAIALAIAAIKEVRIPSFKLAVGHIGLLDAWFGEMMSKEQADRLRFCLYHRDYVGYRAAVREGGFSKTEAELLLSVVNSRGTSERDSDVRDQLAELQLALPQSGRVKQALEELNELWQCFAEYQVLPHLIFDLSLMSDRAYYTGIYFEAYANEVGFPLGSGGRYDHLLGQFGRPAPATGFTLKVDRLVEASPLNGPAPLRHVLITYTAEERAQAVQLAEKRRSQGERVTLHRLPAQDETIEGVAQRFDEWVRLEKGVARHE